MAEGQRLNRPHSHLQLTQKEGKSGHVYDQTLGGGRSNCVSLFEKRE